jgi:hypothetical protein
VECELPASAGAPHTATYELALPAGDLPDAPRAAWVRAEGSTWQVVSVPTFTFGDDGLYHARVTAEGCGAYALVRDTEAPLVRLDVPEGPLSGVVALVLEASDNLGVARVELYLGETLLLGTGGPGPHRLALDTRQYPDASYRFRALAFDVVGLPGQATLDRTFYNEASILEPGEVLPPAGGPNLGELLLWLTGILGAAGAGGGAWYYKRRMQ